MSPSVVRENAGVAPEKLEALEYLRLLADETRLRALALLRREDELCVCELVWALRLTQPKVSRHLALLRQAGVVRDRRDGIWIYYGIAPDLPGWAVATLDGLDGGLQTQALFRDDHERLLQMPDRPGQRCN